MLTPFWQHNKSPEKTIILEMIKEFFIENDYDIDVESISIVQAKIKNSVVQLIML